MEFDISGQLQREVQPMRIGIFGGTFDPIHLAHLVIAQEALVQVHLDRVLFIPAGQPPHKANSVVAAPSQRRAMVEHAISTDARFAIDPFELLHDGPSYTVETVSYLKEIHTQDDLFLILGGDMVFDLVHWHQPERILQLITGIIAIQRPGFQCTDATIAALNTQMVHLGASLLPIDTPQIDISSSMIRSRIIAGLPIRYFVPDAVADYIATQQLYRLPQTTLHEAKS